MNLRKQDQKLAERQGQPNNPRFKIERLEERIAPTHAGRHGLNGGGGGGGPCRLCARR